MEWLTMVQEQSNPVKALITFGVFVAAGIIIAFIWHAPPEKPAAAAPPPAAAATPAPLHSAPLNKAENSGAGTVFSGVNHGVVTGSYTEAPQRSDTEEELAREQLAGIRRRREEEAAAREKQAEAEDVERERQIVGSLLDEYRLSHDNISPAMMAGTELPPEEWMNGRLRVMGLPYRFTDLGGGSFSMQRQQ